jgi:hypothetical protein
MFLNSERMEMGQKRERKTGRYGCVCITGNKFAYDSRKPPEINTMIRTGWREAFLGAD